MGSAKDKQPRRSWTKEECADAAKQCRTKREFELRFIRQYSYAYRREWIDDICSHMEPTNRKWTKEECAIAAKQCQTRRKFKLTFAKQYNYAWMVR